MSVNAGPYKTGMRETVAEGRRWKREQKQIFEGSRTDLERYQQKIGQLKQRYREGRMGADLFARGVTQLRQQFAATLPGMQQNGNAIMQYRVKLGQLNVAYRQGIITATEHRSALAKVRAEHIATLPGVNASGNAVVQYQAKLALLNANLKAGILTQAQYRAAVHGVTAAHLAAGPAMTPFTAAHTRLIAVQKVLIGQMAMVGSMAAMYLGPIMMIFGGIKMGKMAEEFGQAMNSSLAIMKGVTTELRAEMKATAFDVAYRTKFSMKEAADAYYYLASAGLDAQRSLKAMPVTADFAQAGMFDMARATDILTDVVSAMGLAVKDADGYMQNMTHTSDVLVTAAANANATVEQFGEALMNRGAVAIRATNKEMEQGVAILMALADQGFAKGAFAGTQLFMILRDLKKVAITNRDVFRELGVVVDDGRGGMVDYVDTIASLEETMKGLGALEVQESLMKLGFPMKSVAGIMALIGKSDDIREYLHIMEKVAGATKRVSDMQLTEFNKGWQAFRANIENIAIDQLTPLLTNLGTAIKSITDLMRELSGLGEDMGVKTFGIDDILGTTFGATGGVFVKEMAVQAGVVELLSGAFLSLGKNIGITAIEMKRYNVEWEKGKLHGTITILRDISERLVQHWAPDLVPKTSLQRQVEAAADARRKARLEKDIKADMTPVNKAVYDLNEAWGEDWKTAGFSGLEKEIIKLELEYGELTEVQKAGLKISWDRREAANATVKEIKDQKKAAEELNQAFQGTLGSYAEKIATFGMSSREKEQWKVQQQFGVGSIEDTVFGVLADEFDELEEKAAQTKLWDKLFAETRTPFEKFKADIGQLESWIIHGLAPDTAARMLKKYTADYVKSGGRGAAEIPDVAAKVMGGQAAYSAQVGYLQKAVQQDPHAKLQEKANTFLRTLPRIETLLNNNAIRIAEGPA